MYVEIRLGQLLGPRPGREQGENGQFIATIPHAEWLDGVIPFQRASELQRLYGHEDQLIEAVRNGATDRVPDIFVSNVLTRTIAHSKRRPSSARPFSRRCAGPASQTNYDAP